MKKLSFLVVAVSLLLLPSVSHAASIGGARTLGEGEFSIGLEQEIVFKRKMKDSALLDGSKVEVELDKAYRTMGKLSYGLLDNLDIYTKFGVAKFDVKQKVFDPDESGTKKATSAFAWGLGMKANMPLEDDWFLGLDVQYLRHRNKYNYSATGTSEYIVNEDKLTLYEWHIAPYIAKDLGQFIPYLGARYSDARIRSRGIFEEPGPCNWKAEAKRNVGIFLGVDFKLVDNFLLNIEGRLIDEDAMSVGLIYKF